MHPDVEFRSLIAEADAETYRGHDGVRRWWETVKGAFDDVHWQYEDAVIAPTGNHGVLRVRISGSIRGVPVEQTMWQAVEMRDSRAIWWRFFRSEADALAAAGLD